ncbi:chloramphenicol acetyltransferase [Sphingobacterium sp. DK4209]|uniref:Chloramphenicol acetyltransferase n=1 Tax=Sphingobacterium zhuxiongii TaxID=2662364 RepID=A0A5Q0Q626_9SPHI|nr:MULTISPECIES: CatA-like O-acetyltransferase [unclassified Sphingobacterium]MVZ65851.1 chloramphenicol acetyltransferase [Sphingobacterium sp. DK4209]QGA24806.1 chloramphenicol acetyltransferase [Sphingobacterium sp. dk4302]
MKTRIDINNWPRKNHFQFFSSFEEPFFGINVQVDCSLAYSNAKSQNKSFFLYYLYRTLMACNAVENFKYRIIDGEVYLFDSVYAASTVNRPDNSFGFGYFKYNEDEAIFIEKALQEIKTVRASNTLLSTPWGENEIHFSALPWFNFTGLSHARAFSKKDSCPKISFGKLARGADGKMMMPISIHAHHGLMDAFHVSQLLEYFQDLLDQ